MKVVALVSGGKDSCYNMVQCVKHGHEIVCIANLAPTNRSVQELDSWMFQTVGHNAIHAIAECMQVPLYQGDLGGIAHQKSLEYNEEESELSDEVEDLKNLLQRVKNDFPDVTGVSCGAIFSDYQRNRVENVCSRLGLVCLAYLWRRDQSELLQEMISENVCAILLKTACMGLDPNKDCGKTLAQLQPKLERLKETTGVNVCGEGGEYETFTLDCAIFKKRIVLDKTSIVIDSADMFAPVGYLLIEEFHLETKDEDSILHQTESLSQTGSTWTKSSGDIALNEEEIKIYQSNAVCMIGKKGSSAQHDFFYVTAEFVSEQDNTHANLQTIALMRLIKDQLASVSLKPSALIHNIIVLKDMTDFAQVNAAYSSFFGLQPPSRVCISDSTVKGSLKLECLASILRCENTESTANNKKVLHVQSISGWAPACIGPYSQATMVDGIIRVAGQIPLRPDTMQIEAATLKDEIVQCVRNVHNTLEALESGIQKTIRCIVYFDSSKVQAEGLEKEIIDGWRTVDDSFNLSKILLLSPVNSLPRAARVEFHVHAIANHLESKMDETTNDDGSIVKTSRTLVENFAIHQLRFFNVQRPIPDLLTSNRPSDHIAIIRLFSSDQQLHSEIKQQFPTTAVVYYPAVNETVVEIESYANE